MSSQESLQNRKPLVQDPKPQTQPKLLQKTGMPLGACLGKEKQLAPRANLQVTNQSAEPESSWPEKLDPISTPKRRLI